MFERIRDFREDRQYTQQEIAKLLNISQATYSDYENEKIIIPISALIKLALFYDTSVDYLVGLTDEPKSQPRGKEYR